MFPFSFSFRKFSDILKFWLKMRLKFPSLSASILFAICGGSNLAVPYSFPAMKFLWLVT